MEGFLLYKNLRFSKEKLKCAGVKTVNFKALTPEDKIRLFKAKAFAIGLEGYIFESIKILRECLVSNCFDTNSLENKVKSGAPDEESIQNIISLDVFVKDLTGAVPIYVINLERRKDRWEKCLKTFASSADEKNSSVTRFNAVDGRNLKSTPELLHLFRDNDFEYRQGVVGCALSHMNLWKQLRDGQIPSPESLTLRSGAPDEVRDEGPGTSSPYFYIILEDDVEINTTPETFKLDLNLTLHHLYENPKIDIHFLGHYLYGKFPERPQSLNTYSRVELMDPKVYNGGAYGYILSKAAAAKYLHIADVQGVQRGIDKFMEDNLVHMCCSHSVPDLIFAEYVTVANNVDSDIQRSFTSMNSKNLNTEPKYKVQIIGNPELCSKIISHHTENGRWKDMELRTEGPGDKVLRTEGPGDKALRTEGPGDSVSKSLGTLSLKYNGNEIIIPENKIITWTLNDTYEYLLNAHMAFKRDIILDLNRLWTSLGTCPETCPYIFQEFDFKKYKKSIVKYSIIKTRQELIDNILNEILSIIPEDYVSKIDINYFNSQTYKIQAPLETESQKSKELNSIIESKEWEKRIQHIKMEKYKILTQRQIVPVIYEIIRNEEP
jgi:GR25 family glycosyltransferase involved in LPS biosynthesis